MRRWNSYWLIAAFFLSLSPQAFAQISPGPIYPNGSAGLSFVAALPATCTPGVTASVQLSVAPYTIYYCSATNTWTAVGAGGAVSSVFTRTGAVTAQSGDYTASQVTGAALSTAVAPNQNIVYLSKTCGTQANCQTVIGNTLSVYTATTAVNSSTITCASCNFVNSAAPAGDVGKIAWVTNLSQTGTTSFQTFAIICPQSTISTVNSSTSITLAAANDCTATLTGTANLVWGSDDTANLQAAWTTLTSQCSFGNPNTILLPDAGMMAQSAYFLNAPAACSNISGAENPRGIAVIGQGLSSRIVHSPNFNLATCTGPDTTGTACIGWGSLTNENAGGMYLRDWIMSGPPLNGISTAFTVLYVPSDATLFNFGCSGFGARSTNGIGVYVKSFNASIGSSFFDGCGGLAAGEIDSGAGGIVNLWGQDFFGDIAGNNGLWVKTGTVWSHGNSFGPGLAGGQASAVVFGAGIFHSLGDAFYCSTGASSAALSVGNGGTAYVTQANIIPSSIGCGATPIGISVGNPATLHISQSQDNSASTAVSVASGGVLYDDCGNNFQAGGGTYSISGTVFGSCSTTGTLQVATNITPSTGWGTSGAAGNGVSAVKGATMNETFTVTAAGTPTANPTIAIVFPTPFPIAPTLCYAIQTGGTGSIADLTVSTAQTTTGVTFKWNATPVAASTYQIGVQCSNN